MAFSNAPQYSTYQQKTISFYEDIDARQVNYFPVAFQDQMYQNVFCESHTNQGTGERVQYLRKRAGLSLYTPIPAFGVVRCSLKLDDSIFYVIDTELFQYTVAAGHVHRGTVTGGTSRMGMTVLPYQGDGGVLYLIISDGITLWWLNLSTMVFEAVPGGQYPTPHIPTPIPIDGYLLLAKRGTNELWNSQLSDITEPWDFIESEMYPDTMTGLSRYNNYVMALGTTSIEMFYDAALEEGSPFSRNDSVVITVGCEALWSAVQIDRQFMWVGNTNEGGRTVWLLNDFKPVEVGTPIIREYLDAVTSAAEIYACSFRSKGHHFYMLKLQGSITLVYDMDEKKWSTWTHNGVPWSFYLVSDSNAGTGHPMFIDSSGIHRLLPDSGTDNGIPIHCLWQTRLLDFDTMNRKFLHRLTLVGNRGATVDFSSLINITWTDTDYITWSGLRQIDLSAARPAIVNLGQFRQRAFRFEYSGPNDIRLQGFEVNYNVGVN